jgi:propanol-preferring alcohol dehydrogenase
LQAQIEQPNKQQALGKAARLYQFGQPLKIENVPIPEIGKRDVLLRVRAAGMCHTDIHLSNGLVPLKMPITLGHEIAGEVEATGDEVQDFRKGDRAVVHFWSPCGDCRYCLEGRGMLCEKLFTRPAYGASADGGYAEYCRVSADRLVKVPSEVPIEFAATLGCAGTTAYHAVKNTGQVRLAENVGVYGIGGVGLYTLQLAKNSGAKVIAIGRNPEKLSMAEKLGADQVINSTNEKVGDAIRKATEGRGVDVMFDLVASNESVENATAGLANGGRLVLVGVSAKPLPVDPLQFQLRELSVKGSFMGTKNELETVIQLAKTREIESVATRKYGLDMVNEGLGALGRGEIVGRAYVSP